MNRIATFFVIAFISLADASECIAPEMPGPTMCGRCQDQRGSQCVSSGRWFSCYSSIAACCDSWDIKNQVSSASCVKASEAALNAPDDHDQDSDISEIEHGYCKQVVSLTDAQTNADCMTECDLLVTAGVKPEDSPAWTSKCTHAHWSIVNGRTVVDECFEKWIYGYSQEVNLASINQKLIVDTPALCQLECQRNNECVNWAWVSSLYDNGSEKVGRCLLKDKKMVEMALTIKTSEYPSPNLNAQYCNYGMPHECSTNHYKCLPCDGGDLRCVWESDMHVAGWKYCRKSIDSCAPFSPLTTLAPPTTPRATTTTTRATTTTTTTTTRATTTTTTAAPTTTPAPTTTTAAPTTTPAPTTTTAAPTTTPAPTTTTAAPTTTPAPTTTTAAPTPAPTPVASAESPEEAGTAAPVGSENVLVRPNPIPTEAPDAEVPVTEVPVRPSEEPTGGEPTPKPEGTVAPIEASTAGPIVPTKAPGDQETTTGVLLDRTTPEAGAAGQDDEDAVECRPKDSTEEGGAMECGQPPKKPSCSDRCECRGRPQCSCCDPKGQLYIRVSDRPKRLHFELEN